MPRWRKKRIDDWAGAIPMGTHGYFLSVHVDAEQGTPSIQALGKST